MLSLYSLIINYTVLISELISVLPNMDFFLSFYAEGHFEICGPILI